MATTRKKRPAVLTDPDRLPAGAAEGLARTWEQLLAERYPGTQWEITYDPDRED